VAFKSNGGGCMMRHLICLDNCAFYGSVTGGISTVWYEHISRLIRDKEFELEFIDVYSKENNHRKLFDFSGYKTRKDHLYPLSQYLPFHVGHEGSFIFHSPYYRYCSNSNAVNITTVHDFTYEYFRKGPAKWAHQFYKYNSIRHSDHIVCISENTKIDLLKFLPDIDKKKIHVIYNGVSEDYCVIDKATDFDEVLPFEQKSYLVFLGSRASYKNFDLVKECVGDTKYNLLIVGPKLTPAEEQSLLQFLPKERFKATGFLSNEKLNIVLNMLWGLFILLLMKDLEYQ
jgi:mannosyltransferase